MSKRVNECVFENERNLPLAKKDFGCDVVGCAHDLNKKLIKMVIVSEIRKRLACLSLKLVVVSSDSASSVVWCIRPTFDRPKSLRRKSHWIKIKINTHKYTHKQTNTQTYTHTHIATR